MTDIDRSNSLTDLAARIKAEHEAVSVALKDSVRHAIAAGEMLIEAKEQLKHGQWLPWLNEHCTISERTAQLYMRTARNREAIEANAQSVADLTLNEAAALLAMSSDMKKLLEFAKEASKLTDPEEFFQFCAANDVACMQGNIFNAPEPTPQEAVEWGLFRLFLVRECAFSPEGAYYHADWVQSRGTCSAEHDARRDELAAAIASDFPNPTPFELALIRTAADLLERSENRAANHTSLRMANSAVRIIGKIRDARAARPAPAPKPLSSYGKVQP